MALYFAFWQHKPSNNNDVFISDISSKSILATVSWRNYVSLPSSNHTVIDIFFPPLTWQGFLHFLISTAVFSSFNEALQFSSHEIFIFLVSNLFQVRQCDDLWKRKHETCVCLGKMGIIGNFNQGHFCLCASHHTANKAQCNLPNDLEALSETMGSNRSYHIIPNLLKYFTIWHFIINGFPFLMSLPYCQDE